MAAAMTASPDDAEFAQVDAYIIQQLHEAAARLDACGDTQIRRQEVLDSACAGSPPAPPGPRRLTAGDSSPARAAE
jgi:hypothetical protein